MLIPLSLEFCEVKHHVRSNFQIVNYSVTENILFLSLWEKLKWRCVRIADLKSWIKEAIVLIYFIIKIVCQWIRLHESDALLNLCLLQLSGSLFG